MPPCYTVKYESVQCLFATAFWFIFPALVAKEGQGFEPWEATNLICFQDKHHKPLGQPSRWIRCDIPHKDITGT